MDKDITVAVVMGGPSAEEQISLSTGHAMAEALRGKGYQVKEIRLVPHNFFEQVKESGADVVVIAVHGLYGEDGRLQSALEMMGIPYTGSGVLASSLSMNKLAAKRVFLGSGIPTPDYIFLHRRNRGKQDMIKAITEKFSLPVVVKPVSQGSSLGVTIEKDVSGLQKALDEAFLVEQIDAVVDLTAIFVILRTGFSGNGEPLRDRHTDIGHFREVGALAAEELAHIGVAFREQVAILLSHIHSSP